MTMNSATRVNWKAVGLLVLLVFAVYWLFYPASKRIQPTGGFTVVETEKSVEKQLEDKELRIQYLERSLRQPKDKTMEKFTGQKLVHLDLKGAPPKMEYLVQLLPYFRRWGATGVLVEYEDMFPYTGVLALVRRSHAYSDSDIKTFLDAAMNNQLIVVPLVQTFGHLEFLLKHKEFAHLRETANYTNSLCPVNRESVPMVKTMIDQVMALHPDIKWFHVGGDEVWNIKTCPACMKDERNPQGLFVDHMAPIFQHVRSRGKIALFWDDMLRTWSVDKLQAMVGLAEPMIWNYVANPAEHFPEGMWQRYAQVFPRIWAASAFKGATFPWSNVPPIEFHVTNNLRWLDIVSSLPPSMEVVGIALTGWSRYDHYATMCELLPTGLPSLAFCLAALNNGKMDDELRALVAKELSLPASHPLNPAMPNYVPPIGNFPGSEVYTMVSRLEVAVYRMNGVLHLERAWMLERQENEKFLSFHHTDTAVQRTEIALQIMRQLRESDTMQLLLKFYDQDTAREWMLDKIDAPIKHLTALRARLERLRLLAAA